MRSRMLALLLAACNSDSTPSQAPPPPHQIEQHSPRSKPAVGEDNQAFADPGGRNPPLPADNPVWDWDAGGFVSDPRWYGEHTWADVRMRVAGHITAAGRDLARAYASKGQWQQAADAYADLARRLDALPVPKSGTAHEILLALSEAAHRDQDLLSQVAKGQLEDPGTTDLSGLRARYLALALRHDMGGTDSPKEARALQAALRPLLLPDDSLDIDAFHDFDDRHQLRIRLTRAYLDGLDPIGLDERWDYWRPTETRRQALVIGLAASHLGGEDWTARVKAVLVGDPPPLDQGSALRWPSQLAHALHDPDQVADFTVDGLGRLPTGDSLIDTGGWPGPAAIGTLERLGLDDPKHRATLETWQQTLDQDLATDPTKVPAQVAIYAAKIDALGHGSRYYNIKQLRNEAVRQLALAHHPDLALTVLRANRPLHNQDWACPNRTGILLALEGRLEAEAGQRDAAITTLRDALKAAEDFLKNVTLAEQAPPGQGPGRRPPVGPPPKIAPASEK